MLTNLLYIDVAAFSAVTSAIAAICVAIAAPILYYWRKAKKGICKTLHIDENKNKEVEEDLVITEDCEQTENSTVTEVDQTVEEVVETVETVDQTVEVSEQN